MSQRYDIAHATGTPLRVLTPDTVPGMLGEENICGDDHALVIGDADASAFAVVGSREQLHAFARRVAVTVADLGPDDTPDPAPATREGTPGPTAAESGQTRPHDVTWTLSVDAQDPLDAARRALAMHRDPTSWATVFTVTDADGDHSVDLDPDGIGVTPDADDTDNPEPSCTPLPRTARQTDWEQLARQAADFTARYQKAVDAFRVPAEDGQDPSEADIDPARYEAYDEMRADWAKQP